ncbi:MAG: hypothetical protein ACYDAY_11985 [Candidatus Dormibacteria bacterium]
MATLPGEVRTAGGLIIPPPEGQLHAWVKPKGEPAMILIETPTVVRRKRQAAVRLGAPELLFHEWSYSGMPIAYPTSWASEMAIGNTYKPPGRLTGGTILNGDCPCEECVHIRGFGGIPLTAARDDGATIPEWEEILIATQEIPAPGSAR